MDGTYQYTYPDPEELGYSRRVEQPANTSNWQPDGVMAYDEAWDGADDGQDQFGPAPNAMNDYCYAAFDGHQYAAPPPNINDSGMAENIGHQQQYYSPPAFIGPHSNKNDSGIANNIAQQEHNHPAPAFVTPHSNNNDFGMAENIAQQEHDHPAPSVVSPASEANAVQIPQNNAPQQQRAPIIIPPEDTCKSNHLSQARIDLVRERYARGFYTCSKCFNAEIEEQRLCDKCYQDGVDAKARRAAGIPPTGGKWAKGNKRPTKPQAKGGNSTKSTINKVKTGGVVKKSTK
ncbi:hypothetical protein QBC45DRAFT_398213 [Copromyces sp. CBS 386.78]|nr:hypothetical protein QBC45DRAFT_398213 [Copromyces sp. CBS 386.78]